MMTAEQLKNSILQLALSGKLVSQDKADESAQLLLDRIREKKKSLIKAKVVPKDKKMDAVSEDEQLFDLPDTWTWTRIGELFQHNTGKALNGSNKEGTVLPYITTSNLYWNRFELNNLKEMPFTEAEMEKCTVTKGDLLVCEGGDYGRAAIWNYDYDIRIQNHVHKLRAYEELCVEYFYYLFNYLKGTGQIKGKGIAIQGLSSGALHNLIVPLPPLNEQYRIVEKIQEIVPIWEKYAEVSTKLNTLNTTFPDMMKKSILQEAVQGKLVPQDPNDEPASVLLKKIAEEKKRLIKEGKIKKQKPLPEITEDDKIFDIPESWEWVRLTDIGEISRGRSQHRPRGDKELYVNGKYPLVQTGDVASAEKYLTDFTTMYNEKGLEQSRMWPKGTLCITIAANIGDVAILDFDACFPDSVVGFLPYCNSIVSEYVYYLLQAFKPLMDAKSTKVAQKNLNVEKLSSIWFPLPPTEEQKRIVNKLDECFPKLHEIHEKSEF